MNASAFEFRLQRFDTEDLPTRARLDSWREILSRKLVQADVKSLDTDSFHAKAYLRALPGIRFGWGVLSPTLHERTRQIVSQDNDDFFFLLNLEGRFVASQSRREISLEPGEAALLACAELGSYAKPNTGKIMFLRLPSAALAGRLPGVYDRVSRVVSGDREALQLLSNYAYALNDRQSLATTELRKLAVDHLYDLIALSLGQPVEEAEEASQRSLSAARLDSIRKFVAFNLKRPEFSIAEVAQRHRLSPRQIQRLFQQTGLTFSEYVQGERLALVYLELTDPCTAHKSIGDIVLDSGFGDVSHFNRACRRRYGASPSDVRRFEMGNGASARR